MVHVASSVEQALSLSATERFDLVLSDLHLPDGDGRTLMAALHSHCQVPGIAMTGDDSLCDVSKPRAQGFAFTLAKPLDFAGLFAAVRNVLLTTC